MDVKKKRGLLLFIILFLLFLLSILVISAPDLKEGKESPLRLISTEIDDNGAITKKYTNGKTNICFGCANDYINLSLDHDNLVAKLLVDNSQECILIPKPDLKIGGKTRVRDIGGISATNLKFKTEIERINGTWIYNHTMDSSLITDFYYDVPKGATWEGNKLRCGNFIWDFNDAVNKQGIDVSKIGDEIRFRGNLDFIDPSVLFIGTTSPTNWYIYSGNATDLSSYSINRKIQPMNQDYGFFGTESIGFINGVYEQLQSDDGDDFEIKAAYNIDDEGGYVVFDINISAFEGTDKTLGNISFYMYDIMVEDSITFMVWNNTNNKYESLDFDNGFGRDKMGFDTEVSDPTQIHTLNSSGFMTFTALDNLDDDNSPSFYGFRIDNIELNITLTNFIDINISKVNDFTIELEVNSTFNGSLNYSIDGENFNLCDYCNTSKVNLTMVFGYHEIRGIWNGSQGTFFEQGYFNVSTNTSSNISITPLGTVYTNIDLNLSLKVNGTQDGINASILWWKNTIPMNIFNSNITCDRINQCYAAINFSSTNFTKHDNITGGVLLHNGFQANASIRYINNSIPTIDSALIKPLLPADADNLDCNLTNVRDIDINDTINISYNWANSSDGVAFKWLNFDNFSFPNGNTSTGQFWKCAAYPNDNETNGVNVTSASVELDSSNSAPTINAVNITTNKLISNSVTPTNNNSHIVIGVNWTDLDGDNATIYACKTNSFIGTTCEDGYWIRAINTTNLTIEMNYTDGNFTLESNTVYIFALSNNTLLSSSKSQTFDANFPPTRPANSAPPTATAFSNSVSFTTIQWSSSTDPNADSVRYIAYGDASGDPTTNLTNTTGTTFLWSPLVRGNTYTWKIRAVDEHGYSSLFNSTPFTFSIASPASPPGEGGGPSGIDEEGLIQAARAGLCGNEICEAGENLFNCQQDCGFVIGFDLDDILNCFNSNDFDRCVLDEAGFVAMLFFLLIGAIFIGVNRQRKKKK